MSSSKSGIDFWTDARMCAREFQIEPSELQLTTPEPLARRPRIALVVDSDSWAFANIARQVKKNLSHKYEFFIIPAQVVETLNQVLLMTEGFDALHFFWRGFIRGVYTDDFNYYALQLGFEPDEFRQRFVSNRLITSAIYDHLFLSEGDVDLYRSLFNEILAGYTVSSKKLDTIYRSLPSYPVPTLVAEDGVDIEIFKPINLERFDRKAGEPLIIGWVGNSHWHAESGRDPKGLHSILKPAIEQLKQEGLNLESVFADRQTAFIHHMDMPNYYARIHVYVCTSEIEGTPNPVLEAMACGVPVIATDVGIVPDALVGTLQKSMIVEQRTVEAVKDRIREIYNNPGILGQLSAENLDSVRQWSWSEKVKNFETFFDNMLSSKNVSSRS